MDEAKVDYDKRDIFSIQSDEHKEFQKLCLAQEDIGFAIDALKKLISIPDSIDGYEENSIREHLFYSAIVSYGKMFTPTRRSKIGIIKTKNIETLKIEANRKNHEHILALRHECIAHNDGNSTTTCIGWSEKHEMHFPQRVRKIYWNNKEALEIKIMMEALHKELLRKIYALFRNFDLEDNKEYVLTEGAVIKVDRFKSAAVKP